MAIKDVHLLVQGFFGEDSYISHYVGVDYELGVILDGCHTDKPGGGIVYKYSLKTAKLLLVNPIYVFLLYKRPLYL